MSRNASSPTRRALIVLSTMCLTSCQATGAADRAMLGRECPPFPVMSKAAADELRLHCFPRTQDGDGPVQLMLCPATWSWLNRLNGLQHQLAECGR